MFTCLLFVIFAYPSITGYFPHISSCLTSIHLTCFFSFALKTFWMDSLKEDYRCVHEEKKNWIWFLSVVVLWSFLIVFNFSCKL